MDASAGGDEMTGENVVEEQLVSKLQFPSDGREQSRRPQRIYRTGI